MDARGCWIRSDARSLVEDALPLAIKQFVQHSGNVAPNNGCIIWRDDKGQPLASAEYLVRKQAYQVRLELKFSFPGPNIEVAQDIGLTSLPQPFGSQQWYFICPVAGPKGMCGRKARIIYLPPGHDNFRCRRCANLTYLSQRLRRQGNRSLVRTLYKES